MKSLKAYLKAKKYIQIPLALTATNHFEVAAEINGILGHFILDTGASNTCIGMHKIDFFNLITEISDIKAAGAGATEMKTFISNKNRVELGAWKKKKQKLVLFDLVHVNNALTSHNAKPVDGIIGADILKKGKGIIDYDKKKLYLK